MKTIDEQGNEVPDPPAIDLAALGPLAQTVRVAQQLRGLHSSIVSAPVNKKAVITAVGLAAVVGIAYLLNRNSAPQEVEYEPEEGEENEEEGYDDEN